MFWLTVIDVTARREYETASARYMELEERAELVFDHVIGVHGAPGDPEWTWDATRVDATRCPKCGLDHEEAEQEFYELERARVVAGRRARNAFVAYQAKAKEWLMRCEQEG